MDYAEAIAKLKEMREQIIEHGSDDGDNEEAIEALGRVILGSSETAPPPFALPAPPSTQRPFSRNTQKFGTRVSIPNFVLKQYPGAEDEVARDAANMVAAKLVKDGYLKPATSVNDPIKDETAFFFELEIVI